MGVEAHGADRSACMQNGRRTRIGMHMYDTTGHTRPRLHNSSSAHLHALAQGTAPHAHVQGNTPAQLLERRGCRSLIVCPIAAATVRAACATSAAFIQRGRSRRRQLWRPPRGTPR